MSTPGFEGSYLGAHDKISPLAIMECKICWTTYDPQEGDDTRQVLPGTAFTDLPHDWSCPGCSAPASQFLVREDPGAPAAAAIAEQQRRTEALVADFREVFHALMRDMPMVNHALHVQAVGFQPHEGGFLGILISPLSMNLVFLPPEDFPTLPPTSKQIFSFPSGEYEFLHNSRELTGPYLACSLFSPMGDFTSQLQAVEIARAVMGELFRSENRVETDRNAENRSRRETELAAGTAAPKPSRRVIITGGLGR